MYRTDFSQNGGSSFVWSGGRHLRQVGGQMPCLKPGLQLKLLDDVVWQWFPVVLAQSPGVEMLQDFVDHRLPVPGLHGVPGKAFSAVEGARGGGPIL